MTFKVQEKQCSTCIYKKSSPLNLKELEAQIADPNMQGFFIGHRICHHSEDVCCRGFWNKHKNHFQMGQVMQRINSVEFVNVDNMSDHKLGDAPIVPELHDLMNGVANALDYAFNGEEKGEEREIGFVLLTFPYNDHQGRCNFISNGADRKDIVVLFKEMIARFEGQPEMKGHA